MDRRDFITISSAVGIVAFAGCTGDGGDDASGDGDDERDDGDDGRGDDDRDGDDTPTATLVVTDQRTTGKLLTIDELETESGTSLVVMDERGEELAGSGVTFEPGETRRGYTVEFSEPIETDRDVTVRLVDADHGIVAETSASLVIGEPTGEPVFGEITLIDADPGLGFEYPYYLYLPETVTNAGGPVLVEPNNTGTTSDSLTAHRDAAHRIAERGVGSRIADEIDVPLLVPIFPRPREAPVDWRHYVHALDAETMAIDDGPLQRVDRQLLAMVDHARTVLGAVDYDAEERILMNGFSASGNFVNRFAVLHPDRVRSVTAGGINGTAILPRSATVGRTLPYPIGVDDIEALTGEPFDDEAWADVAQYVYMGADDDNDTIPYGDAWNDDLREIALDVYGEDMQEDRMPFCEGVYADAGAAAQFAIYEGIGHATPTEIVADCVEFHRRNMDLEAEFEPIEPTTPAPTLVDLSIADPLEAGDTSVVVDVVVAEEWDRSDNPSIMVFEGPETDFSARIEDSGDRSQFLEAGTDETVTLGLDETSDAVPLEANDEVTVGMIAGSPIATETVIVEER